MKLLQSLVLKLAAIAATRKPIAERYSLSSSKSPNYNFTYLKLHEQGDEQNDFLVLSRPKPNGLVGIGWPDGVTPGVDMCLPFTAISKPRYEISRIYKSVRITYHSPVRFLIGELTLAHKRLNWREFRTQRAFEKNFRFSSERMEILSKIVDWQRRARSNNIANSILDNEFAPTSAYSEIYTQRAWLLEEKDRFLSELVFVLESLVSTGELRKSGISYKLNGSALSTLSKYEDSKRRFQAQERHNSAIKWLTLFIAASAVIQLLKK